MAGVGPPLGDAAGRALPLTAQLCLGEEEVITVHCFKACSYPVSSFLLFSIPFHLLNS